jgi:8-oxo-dGTP diphosphatase
MQPQTGGRQSKVRTRKAVEVAAGLVFRNGRLLITRRPAGSHLGGLWEFPGGKRETGETSSQCLVRELLEELGIEVEIGRKLETVTHDYPDKRVRLQFFHCRWKRREPQPLGCAAFKWVEAAELDDHKFPAADARLIKRLQNSPRLWH